MQCPACERLETAPTPAALENAWPLNSVDGKLNLLLTNLNLAKPNSPIARKNSNLRRCRFILDAPKSMELRWKLKIRPSNSKFPTPNSKLTHPNSYFPSANSTVPAANFELRQALANLPGVT